MIAYTTVEYYTNKYLKGRAAVIDTAVFPFYAQKATQVIKRYTLDNVDETKALADELQMCCCDMAEFLHKQENADHDIGVQSEKKGEWSTTYATGEEVEKLKQGKIREIIYNWLDGTGLLYRGC